MAITELPSQQGDATPPVFKLRGRGTLIALMLPPVLIDAADVVAAEEDRARAKMIEIILRRGVEELAARKNAA
jgi:hypothetical protein